MIKLSDQERAIYKRISYIETNFERFTNKETYRSELLNLIDEITLITLERLKGVNQWDY
jgi:hypothetical protein